MKKSKLILLVGMTLLFYPGMTIDASGEGTDVADLTFLTNYLYKGGPEPIPLEAGNIDGIFGPAGPIDNNDLVYLIDYLYRGGPEPACE